MGKLLTAPLFVFLLFFIYGVLRSLTARQQRYQRRAMFFLLFLTLVLGLLSMPAVTAKLAWILEKAYPYPSSEVMATVDVVTVLSSNVHHGAGAGRPELDQASYIRTTVGARAFVQAEPKLMVVQGALGGGGTSSDSHAMLMTDVMAELAISMGVPPEAVRREPRSRNTREHPVELLRVEGVSPDDVIGVVTSAWHLPRAVSEFERHFDRVVPIPADYFSKQLTGTLRDWIPQARALAESTTVVHEWIGRLWYLGLAVGPRTGLFQFKGES